MPRQPTNQDQYLMRLIGASSVEELEKVLNQPPEEWSAKEREAVRQSQEYDLNQEWLEAQEPPNPEGVQGDQ